MAIAIQDFLHSLCLHLSVQLGLAYEATPRGLWRNRAVDADSADPYSVVACYGGPPQSWGVNDVLLIQVKTTGEDDAANAQAQSIFGSLHDGAGYPAHGRTIPAITTADVAVGTYKLIAIDFVSRPGLSGRDDRGRCEVTFNVQMTVAQAT
jgi:hypothetical protein